MSISSLHRRLDKLQAAMPKVDENKGIIESNIIYRIKQFKAKSRGEPFTIDKNQEAIIKLMKSGQLNSMPKHNILPKIELIMRTRAFKRDSA